LSRLRRSAVQIADENTLVLWSYDPISQTWSPLSGTLHLQNNTVTAAVIEPGLLALVGEIYSGPWKSIVEQSLGLPPTLPSPHRHPAGQPGRAKPDRNLHRGIDGG
jgi:hypothetical protein